LGLFIFGGEKMKGKKYVDKSTGLPGIQKPIEPVDKDEARQRLKLIHIIMTHVVRTKNPSSNEKQKIKYQLERTPTKKLKLMRKRCNMGYYKKRNK
jgi:hypothetical protein